MKIVVDAMGGDHAPAVVVEGAVPAAREFGVEIILVGRAEEVQRELGISNTMRREYILMFENSKKTSGGRVTESH